MPPYASSEQQALRAEMLEDVDSDRCGGLPASEVKRYYLAGGLSPIARFRFAAGAVTR